MPIFAPYFVLYEHTKWLKKMRYKNSNIRKCQNTKTIAQCATFFLFCLLPLKGICQTGESTVDALVKMGFENVGWTEDGNERVYVLQNSAYRLQGVGICNSRQTKGEKQRIVCVLDRKPISGRKVMPDNSSGQ